VELLSEKFGSQVFWSS